MDETRPLEPDQTSQPEDVDRHRATGFFDFAGKGIQMPPWACSSLMRRPPEVATSARPPAPR